jgi:hypothetical protein
MALNRRHGPWSRSAFLSSFGDRATLMAIRRASSFVSTFACRASAIVVAGVEVGKRLSGGVPNDMPAGHRVGVPGRREAA